MLVLCAPLALASPVRADEPKALIEKANRAHGGETSQAKADITRTKGKGTIEANGVTIAVVTESVTQLPDKLRTVHEFDIMGQRHTVVTVYNGDKAWVIRAGAATEISGALLDEARQTMHARRVESLLPLVKSGFELAALPEIKVGDKPAVGVKVSAKGMRDCSLYFDKESGLLVRIARKTLDLNQQEADTETTYSAWKDFKGVKLPTKLVVQQAGKKLIEAEITACDFPEQIDPAEFARP